MDTVNVVVKSGVTRDSLSWETLDINGKRVMSVYPLCECPEDAILERDLVGPSDVVNLMEMAYKHGLNGDEMTFTIEEGAEE